MSLYFILQNNNIINTTYYVIILHIIILGIIGINIFIRIIFISRFIHV